MKRSRTSRGSSRPAPQWRLWIAVGLIAVGLLSWALLGRTSDPARPAPTDSPEPLVARAPLLVISGEVVTPEGEPIPGATVYVLPKKYPGGERDKIPHEVSGPDGKWRLRVLQVHDCWIGAMAPGRKIAWLDGTLVDSQARLVHVLEPAQGRRIVVRTAEGEPVPNCGIELIPWPLLQHYELPAPGFREPGSWLVSDEHGLAIAHLATPGPALLRPAPEGRCAHPEVGWLAGDAAELHFEVVPACTLDLCFTDPQQEQPLDGAVSLWLRSRQAPHRPRTSTLSLLNGVGCVERSVRPGHYDVLVEAEGRTPLVVSNVDLSEPGSTRSITSALEPASAFGSVSLTLPQVMPRGLLCYARAIDGALAVAGWRPVPVQGNATTTLRLDLAPGSYDLLVAHPAERLCAVLRVVGIEPGGSVTLPLVLAPGAHVHLQALPGIALELRRLEVEGRALGALPLYGLGTSGRLRLEDELVDLTADTGGKDVFLGPYPDGEIVLRAHGWGGQTRQYAIAR